MSVFTMLETLFIGPLKLIFELVFQLCNSVFENPAVSIVFLSLAINILVLPLYKRADAMQEQARDMDKKLHDTAVHIKKNFSGDEKMMILQTYYRQNNYSPVHALKGSVSLLLEIPFFMAAYSFLSDLQVLDGAALGPIADLSKPDGLLVLGGITINVLPIVMTLINVVSSAIYLKGFPLKTKVQLYAMAAFFLVVLYSSPAGLVFYWTLNNLFSLVKTIFYKLKNPKKVLCVMCGALGAVAVLCAVLPFIGSLKMKLLMILVGLALEIPLIYSFIKKKCGSRITKSKSEPSPDKKLFLVCSVFLTILVGLLVPSALISASPLEFVDVTYYHNPIWYIVSSFLLSAGTFLVWMRVFYWLATPKGKALFERVAVVLCGVMVVNYMFFGTNLSTISSSLQYETGLVFSKMEQLVNLLVVVVIGAGLLLAVKKWGKALRVVCLVGVIALLTMSVINMSLIGVALKDATPSQSDEELEIPLSKTGKNVVVLMLDRAIGEYIPYFVQEKPELLQMYDGFTYYSNVVSYGGHTNLALPALAGGYEYTPVEMNKRSSQSLEEKHNEALKVMPAMFYEEGYDVTVCDPLYAGYEEIPDLSVFDDYPEMNTYNTEKMFKSDEEKAQAIKDNQRNIFCYSLMKTMPLKLQPVLYSEGTYRKAPTKEEGMLSKHVLTSASTSTGVKDTFMDWYSVLDNMPLVTEVKEDGENTFLFMCNEASHEIMLMQEPEYVPSMKVDNTEYDRANLDRFTVDGKTLNMHKYFQVESYETNMAVLLKVGQWFDYLREQGVYDNTKIIIVSDHGYCLYLDENLMFGEEGDVYKDAEMYYPLLLVKDFGSTGFSVSDEFMTIADVPSLTVDGVIENPKNPFTGKAITSDEKNAHEQCISLSDRYVVAGNNGSQFTKSLWASVSQDIHNRDNWTFGEVEQVLTRHKVE